MAFESDFLDMMPQTVTVHPYTGEDAGHKPTYGTSRSVRCAIKDDVKRWRWEDGTEIQSRRMIYFSDSNVTARDKIVLPAGYEPQTVLPLYLIRRDDEDGYHHTEAYI